jgi:hypothetical protein
VAAGARPGPVAVVGRGRCSGDAAAHRVVVVLAGSRNIAQIRRRARVGESFRAGGRQAACEAWPGFRSGSVGERPVTVAIPIEAAPGAGAFADPVTCPDSPAAGLIAGRCADEDAGDRDLAAPIVVGLDSDAAEGKRRRAAA